MKKSRLLEIIREEISAALDEVSYAGKGAIPQMKKDPKYSSLSSDGKLNAEKELTSGGTVELEEDLLNEVPDFGGQLDQGVAIKYGEEDTLQNAVDAIVDETLADMGVTLEDLKKDEAKATKALNSIREKVLGAKRKDIPQDPRVAKALKKQEDIEIDKFGTISGKDLQANQTNNAIKKALGLIVPDKRGRPADPNKPEKAPSTGKRGRPAGTKVATRTAGDDGFDDVTYSDVDVDIEDVDTFDTEKAPAGDVEMEKAARGRDELIKQYKTEVEPELKDKIAKAKEGDTEAMSWLKSKQDIIKRYNKAKQVNV